MSHWQTLSIALPCRAWTIMYEEALNDLAKAKNEILKCTE
jgi:hypothetical protein